MNDNFEKKVRAAVAGWWVVLIAAGFVTLQWLIYLAVMSAQPGWVLAMWGPDVSWAFVQNVWFWGIVAIQGLRLAYGFGGSVANPLGKAVA
jgi:hypothetical protein